MASSRSSVGFCRTTTHVYKEVGGCGIHVDLHRPQGSAVVPGLLWLHGGALIGGGRGDLPEDERDFYISCGYAVASLDYRLAPETRLPAIIDDLRDGWSWLSEKGASLGAIDPARLAVVGRSAGGHLTLIGGFCLTPRPRALVSFYGYGDVVGGWYSRPDPFYCTQPAVPVEEAREAVGSSPLTNASWTDRRRFYLYCRQNGLWPREVVGLDPDRDREAYRPYNPVWNVTDEYPPTLLLHGDLDTDVPYAQSLLMAYRLLEAGVPHRLHTVLGGGHGFVRSGLGERQVEDAFEEVRVFLGDRLV